MKRTVIIVANMNQPVAYPTLEEIKQQLSQLNTSSLFIAANILYKAKEEIARLSDPPGAPETGSGESVRSDLNRFVEKYREQYPQVSKQQAEEEYYRVS
jgi:predicted Zn-dependent peptidase